MQFINILSKCFIFLKTLFKYKKIIFFLEKAFINIDKKILNLSVNNNSIEKEIFLFIKNIMNLKII